MTRLVIVGGSDAGISAALRAKEVEPGAVVEMLLSDRWPNYSICGLPYLVSGAVPRTTDLAHRTVADIEAAGITVRTEHRVTRVDQAEQTVQAHTPAGQVSIGYDALVLATGAEPRTPPIDGLDADRVKMLHTVDDALALADRLPDAPRTTIVGGGYIGLEMAEAFVDRGRDVTLVERLPEVMPTMDAEIGTLVRGTLERHGVRVLVDTPVRALVETHDGLHVLAREERWPADLVLVVAGVQPVTDLGRQLGIATGVGGALVVGDDMATTAPQVWAAGDCVHTRHRLLDQPTYLPLGTTAHKQGRVAGENAVGGSRRFAGILGTQVVKVFDLAVAGTGLRDATAPRGTQPRTTQSILPDHNRYYPDAVDLTIRVTADRSTGLLLGAQIAGPLRGQVAKRIDTLACALHHHMTVEAISDLDLSYTPPFSAPWDPLQAAAQAWTDQAAGRAGSAHSSERHLNARGWAAGPGLRRERSSYYAEPE